MALTEDFRHKLVDRIKREPEFAVGLFDEAITAYFAGEPNVARAMLREIVNGTLGFEPLAKQTKIPPKSLHRMLSGPGNPSMDNLALILGALQAHMRVVTRAHSSPPPKTRTKTSKRPKSK